MKIVILSLLLAVAFSLDVSIDLVSQSPLSLNFTISNPGTTDVTFLQWGTPFEGIWEDMFDIRDEQFNRVTYAGMLVRRGADPIDSEFVTIPAGGMQSVIVDLGENYEFTTTGKYMVRVSLPQYSELVYTADDNQVVVFKLETVPERRPVGAPQGFTNCNTNQVSQITAAITTSTSRASRSLTCLSDASGCSSYYATWFGTYSDGNWNHVTNTVFRPVHNKLAQPISSFNGHCNPAGCGTNVYGYVYPTDNTHTVYMCDLFWRTTNQERINTIIHEVSHFRTYGGTQDYTYGTANCKNLARSNPNNAARNADNICYFASDVSGVNP